MLKDVITVTTAADGSATAYSRSMSGRIRSVIYTKGDYTNGVDFTITTEHTGRGVWTKADVNASTWVNPRDIIHDNVAGAQVLGSAGWADIYLVMERLKIVLAQGGDTKTGTFTLIVSAE